MSNIVVSKEHRSISKSVSVDNEGRKLEISVYHRADRKEYLVTLQRRKVSGKSELVHPSLDFKDFETRPATRYSFKTLEGIFSEVEGKLEDEQLKEWARAKTL